MKSFHFILAFTLLFFQKTTFSQNIGDLLRYSQTPLSGTARYIGAGGAFGALGADYGTLSSNPAGIAAFRTDELVLTPALRFTSTDALLRGNGNISYDEGKTNFRFQNAGFVFNTDPRDSCWSTFNVALGFNQLANFNYTAFYVGKSAGTITTGWYNEVAPVISGGGTAEDLYPFTGGVAYEASAVYDQNGTISYDFIGLENSVMERSQFIKQNGSLNEMVVSFGGNYAEKLMVGATVGVPFINYKLEGSYEEKDNSSDEIPYFDALNYTETLRTNGIGVNLKMGLIYKAHQNLRLGAAFHTPTLYGLTENFSTTLKYDFTDGGGAQSNTALSPDGTNDYKMRTPWRAMVSAAFLANKYGFLSADAEWVDYSAGKFNLTSNVNSTENELEQRRLNDAVALTYKTALNLRLGGEAVYQKFRFRAGLNLLGKAEEDASGFNRAYTAGIGVRNPHFYIDLGARFGKSNGSLQPYYDEVNQPLAETSTGTQDYLLTLGFKF